MKEYRTCCIRTSTTCDQHPHESNPPQKKYSGYFNVRIWWMNWEDWLWDGIGWLSVVPCGVCVWYPVVCVWFTFLWFLISSRWNEIGMRMFVWITRSWLRDRVEGNTTHSTVPMDRWMMSWCWLSKEICPMCTGYPSISGFWEKYYYSFWVYCTLVRNTEIDTGINQPNIDVVVACRTPVGHRSNIYNNSTRMGMWPCSLIDIVNIIYI